MLSINATDQTASPVEDKNSQEQSQSEPLPWEVGRISLKKFIDTSVLLIRNPKDALARPLSGRLARPWGFFMIYAIISSFFISVYSFFIFDGVVDPILAKHGTGTSIVIILEVAKVFIPGFILSIYHMVFVGGLIYYPLISLCLLVCLHVLGLKVSLRIIYQILLYTEIAGCIHLIPIRTPYTGYIHNAWQLGLLVIALKCYCKASWLSSSLIVAFLAIIFTVIYYML